MSTNSNNAVIQITSDWSLTPKIYYLQFKTPEGLDAGLAANYPTWLNNVQVKSWSGLTGVKSFHEQTISNGATWTDSSKCLSVFVKSLNLTLGTANVIVTLSYVCGTGPSTYPRFVIQL